LTFFQNQYKGFKGVIKRDELGTEADNEEEERELGTGPRDELGFEDSGRHEPDLGEED